MIFVHLALQMLTLSSGFALWLLLLLPFVKKPDRRRATALILHGAASLYAGANILLFLSYNLEALYMLPLRHRSAEIFFFAFLPRLFAVLRLILPLLAGLLIYQCRRQLGAEKKRLALMGLCLIPPAALSLARNLFPELPLDPAALIYSRTGAYFLLNMILYFRLYQDKPEPEKSPLKTGEAIKKDLTTREREVFDHLISHASYKEIGAALFISLDTVKSHASRIYRKTNVSGRNELIRRLEKEG